MLSSHQNNAKGFTLIEVLVVLGIIGALLASIVPLGAQLLESSREDATRAEMREIHKAIFGEPEKGNFGYIGDIGGFPANLNDLVVKPANIPNFTYCTHNVGYGWRGPYLSKEFSDLRDAWGNTYRFGYEYPGQISSAGADHRFETSDDIVFPYVPDVIPGADMDIRTAGTLQITVFVNNIPNPQGCNVDVYYASNGTEVTPPLKDNTPNNGFSFSVHQGIHAVEVSHASADTPPKVSNKSVNVQVIARSQVSEEIFLTNPGNVNP